MVGFAPLTYRQNLVNFFFLFVFGQICWIHHAYVAVLRSTTRDSLRNNFRKDFQPSLNLISNHKRNISLKLSAMEEFGGNSTIASSNRWFQQTLAIWQKKLSRQWCESLNDFQGNPYQYLSIPVVAALVGYVTNYIGVWMLFHPIEWKGLPIKRWPQQPFGILGWQGVVPAKRFVMSAKMVDVTINRLLSIKEVFQQLDLTVLSSLFTQMLHPKLYAGLLPYSITNLYVKRIVKDVIGNIEKIIDLRQLVITKMTTDPSTLGTFFQNVGRKELQFLVSSGTYFGFGLGIIQMFQWMIYPNPWTLPIGGAIVGYITNWIALKWIFEPLTPQAIGPFILQGLFLKRQREVTHEFVQYMTNKVLYSQELWRSILLTPTHYQQFLSYIEKNLPSLLFPPSKIEYIGKVIKESLLANSFKSGKALSLEIGPRIHRYIDNTLQLKALLTQRMNALTPKEFEQILHPIFQEDELTLIIAGGILGMIAGFGQMLWNYHQEKRRKERSRVLLVE